jgi:hypothetical protein
MARHLTYSSDGVGLVGLLLAGGQPGLVGVALGHGRLGGGLADLVGPGDVLGRGVGARLLGSGARSARAGVALPDVSAALFLHLVDDRVVTRVEEVATRHLTAP